MIDRRKTNPLKKNLHHNNNKKKKKNKNRRPKTKTNVIDNKHKTTCNTFQIVKQIKKEKKVQTSSSSNYGQREKLFSFVQIIERERKKRKKYNRMVEQNMLQTTRLLLLEYLFLRQTNTNNQKKKATNHKIRQNNFGQEEFSQTRISCDNM